MAMPGVVSQVQRVQRLVAGPLGRNIVSNYLTVVWLGGLGIALIPLYLHLLGPEQWGVVAICITVQTFAGLLDAGLAQILPRDIARCQGDQAAQARVYRVFARAYFVLGLAGFCLGQLALTLFFTGAVHWFDAGVLAHEAALRLVLLQFFFQFANNASVGYWNGRQAQALANARQCVFGTGKHLMAIGLLTLYAPQVLSYVLGFVLVGALEWWWNRRTVVAETARHGLTLLRAADFRTLAGEAGVLALGVFVGMLVSQLDRLVLSATVPVVEFGRYAIVANLGLAFLQLQYPLMRALFPRVVSEQGTAGQGVRRRYWWAVLGLCVLPCLLVIPLVPWVLHLWLHDADIVAQGSGPLRLILAAVAINSIYHLIYQKIVAQGRNVLILGINGVVLAVLLPTLLLTAPQFGILAGGISWFIMAALQLTLALIWLAMQINKPPDNRIS